jgi:LysR family transcriptional regulator, glycine cleavage system transcriptional activator
MAEIDRNPPLNAIRAFVAIVREMSVTRAAASLGITQSAASRYLVVLDTYLGGRLLNRRGRSIEITPFGRLFFDATADALESVAFTARRMRQRNEAPSRLIVRTSLPTFAYSTLIPNLSRFSATHQGTPLDVVTSLVMPKGDDQYDVFITRNLELREAADQWVLLLEQVVCVGTPAIVAETPLDQLIARTPILTVNSRPDLVPRWANALSIAFGRIIQGPRYDHHFLAIPAAATGQGMLVTPEILVADLLRQHVLVGVAHSQITSGMRYFAYAVDRAGNVDLARAPSAGGSSASAGSRWARREQDDGIISAIPGSWTRGWAARPAAHRASDHSAASQPSPRQLHQA